MNETDTFASDMGRLMELGFNTGVLTNLTQRPEIRVHYGDSYERDLRSLSLQPLYARLCENTRVLNSWDKELLERWLLFQLLRGYLSGYNFLGEYLQSFAHDKKNSPREIVYLQCNFYGQSSLGIYPKNERTATQEVLAQFERAGFPLRSFSDEDRQKYLGRGHFLRADVLLLLRYGSQWRILCVDISVFALRSLADAGDLADIETIRRLLGTEIHYTRSKSVFSNLNIDTDAVETTQNILGGKLRHYFAAFAREDKESSKLIQAASYLESFYDFLLERHVLTPHDSVLFNVVGYTDRAVNAIALKKDQVAVLKTCAQIYREGKGQSLQEERAHVLRTIRKAATYSFQKDARGSLVEKLSAVGETGDALQWIEHEERLTDFVNTLAPLPRRALTEEMWRELKMKEGESTRDAHSRLVLDGLDGLYTYLFLTGHAGIGKTTALVKFLKERRNKGEGFLLLYASPRKHVNLDIIRKFREDEFGLHCDDLLALTANTVAIRSNASTPTVHYFSHHRQDRFRAHGVDFVSMESEDARRQYLQQRSLEEVEEGLLIDKGERISGVLDSLCSALYAALDEQLSDAIVATVAIQSLKSTHLGQQTTLRHLKKMFTGTEKATQVDKKQLQKIAKRIRHIFVMVDEVTGDEGGAAFVDGIHAFLKQQGLLGPNEYGFNTKIIVADASIVSPEIIKQHLEGAAYEPDKIYFRLEDGPSAIPLSQKEMQFKRLPALAINANSYPASALRLRYRLGLDVVRYDEAVATERRKQQLHDVQQRILQDIMAALNDPSQRQLLVYIQDKHRLARLIQAIREQGVQFRLYQEYLEIHANISDLEKQNIEKFQDRVRVVFMTASASRGLSFKKATHILVDIPHFEIEQNLMEILQVIYRGRGGDFDQEEKTITFYLSETVFYQEDLHRILAIQERVLHILNILLILKTSMMTRLVGSGQLGRGQRFLMVPIGGKSILAAGDTLSARLGRLIKELQDLSRRSWNDQRLEYVSKMLLRILREARILLLRQYAGDKRLAASQSYIPLIPHLLSQFHEAARKGFDHLLALPPLEAAYHAGGLLIVPAQNHTVQESYWTDVKTLLRQQKGPMDLLTCIRELCADKRYPDTVRLVLEEARVFIEHLERMSDRKTSYYLQESSHLDQHYAFPLITLLAHKEMLAYFAAQPQIEEQPETSFRSMLIAYLRGFYPVDSVLPIGGNYKQFPFLVFRSFNLQEARQKMFTSKYMFMSHELNILNMMLSSKEEGEGGI